MGPKTDPGTVEERDRLMSSPGIEIRFDVRPAHTLTFTASVNIEPDKKKNV